jgi:SAM-dependent methyltransferase
MSVAHMFTSVAPKMGEEEAIAWLRSKPEYQDLVRYTYWNPDIVEAANRFSASAEFGKVCAIAGDRIKSAAILDLGAGTGIASWAFTERGAHRVYAVEPSPSAEIGRGAIRRLCATRPVEIIDASGERLPLFDSSIDLVYARQVLHHTRDLRAVLSEIARVLRPGGMFIACREHVVDNERQLQEFLNAHIMHRLTGGENAYRLSDYINAIQLAGLTPIKTIGPWESVINAFPAVHSEEELRDYPCILLISRFGSIGRYISRIPGIGAMIWLRLKRRIPGRMFSFVAIKGLSGTPGLRIAVNAPGDSGSGAIVERSGVCP